MATRPSPGIYEETLAVFARRDEPYEPLTTPEVADALDANRRTVYKRLARLVERGDLRTKSVGARARVWWPAAARSDAGDRDGRAGADAAPDRTEAALRESEARYRTLFESIDEGFCIVEVLFDSAGEPADYRFLETNPAFEEQTGLDDAVGKTMRELAPAHERHWFEIYGDVVRTGEPVRFEAEARPLMGGWYDVHAFPCGGPDSACVAILFEDVTDRKEREQALERYEHIVETVPDGVWALDADDRFVLVNDAYCDLTGYDRESLLGAHATLVTSESVNDAANAFESRIREGDLDDAILDVEVERADGTTVPIESRFATYELANGDEARCGVVRDVSEHLAREEALAESERRYRTLVDNFPNGVVALFDEDLRYVTVGGDLFEGIDLDPEEVEGQVLGEVLPAAVATQIEPHYRAVFEGRASEFEVTYTGDVRTFQAVPVYDEAGAVVAGLGMSQDVTELWERERQLDAQRQRLATLNHLNTVVRDITHAVIEQSTREQIERTVCESLAESAVYEFAWTAAVDLRKRRIVPRAEAGVDGYLDRWIAHSIDPDHLWSEGPVGRAIRTGELQVTEDVFEESDFEQWHEYAREFGYRSVAAIPIGHEQSLYGVLGLYASGPEAFEDEAREIVGQLGDVVGHAIAAAERKRALMGDDVVELQFQVSDFFDGLGVPVSMDGRLTVDGTATVDDDHFLAYGTATGDGIDALETIVDGHPDWETVSVIDETAGGSRFVARISEPPIVSLVAAHGGYLRRATIEDGDSYVTVHLPTSVDVRRIIEAIQETFPAIVMVARRQVSRSASSRDRIDRVMTRTLTERQRGALEAAFHGGYFDTPRKRSGEEIARSLGISPSTFHQHLRAAEGKLVDAVVATVDRGRQPASAE